MSRNIRNYDLRNVNGFCVNHINTQNKEYLDIYNILNIENYENYSEQP